MMPYFHEFDELRVLVNDAGYTIRVNPINGIVELLDEMNAVTFRCIPAFELIAPDERVFGSSVEFADDVNGDGIQDYYFKTPFWTQVFYALPIFPGTPSTLP